jgi:hypothetical protein
MTNEELVKKVKELLDTESDRGFLMVVKQEDLERLVACIRARVIQIGGEKGHLVSRG